MVYTRTNIMAKSEAAIAAIAQRRQLKRIIEKAELELLYLKSNNKPNKFLKLSEKYESTRREVKGYGIYGEDLVLSNREEWHKGFLYFCNRTHDIYGSRVDRKHLLEYANDYRQRGSSSDEPVKTDPDKK